MNYPKLIPEDEHVPYNEDNDQGRRRKDMIET